ncbi:MAG TPA: hypothetical protein DD390_10410 [Rhodospirillaceae bacterium]|nr:hypothetical protein [Rhodospirillaceae bacterium]HBM13096.1 hypothetical protein [Rhodospirillaceae bacterium]|tara:strand:- start:93887 stop:94591 length:705 start_codon:yes stop_codon:yes gene_type:complete
MDAAWDEPDPNRRAKIARTVLEMDLSVIDAYGVLSECVDTNAERVALLREGVLQGEKIWAQHLKPLSKNYFWQVAETRPFMQVLSHLSEALWEIGDQNGAADTVERLLRLNPQDNQGCRWRAVAWYPVLGEWPKVEKILRKYKVDTGTYMTYTKLLNCIRCGTGVDAAFEAAMGRNRHVLKALLTARDRYPGPAPDSVSRGSEEEALSYAIQNLDAWQSVPGALDWIRAPRSAR